MKAIVLSLVLVVAVGAADDTKTQAVLRQIMKGQLDVIKHCIGLRGYPYRGIQYPHAPQKHDHIAFHVRSKDGFQNVQANQKIIFDTVDLNIGNAYKESDGTFTAPKTGVYIFSWTTVTLPGKYFVTELIVDGHVKGANYNSAANGGNSHSQPGTQLIVVKMTKKQQAWLKNHGNHGLKMRGWYWSSFSGFILF